MKSIPCPINYRLQASNFFRKRLYQKCFLVSFAEFQKSYILYLNYFDQWLSFIRSSRSQIFCRKGALRNLTKFTEKHLCRLPLSVPVLQNICEKLLLFHLQSALVILQQGFSYSEFFWSVFSHIRTEYGEIRTLFYAVLPMRILFRSRFPAICKICFFLPCFRAFWSVYIHQFPQG